MAAEALAKSKREAREFYPRVREGTSLWEVASPLGGKAPWPLQGSFTTEANARTAIERYAATGR